MIVYLAIAVSFFVAGVLVGGMIDYYDRRRTFRPDASPPSLPGHRPGIMSTDWGETTTFSAFCSCNWKGNEHGTEAGARGEASNHAKGLL